MTNQIKLINIHTRNLAILRAQKANMGAGVTPHVENSIQIEIDELKSLESQLRRRLRILQEQAAIKGLSSDPSITLEIEDIAAALERIRDLHLDEESDPAKLPNEELIALHPDVYLENDTFDGPRNQLDWRDSVPEMVIAIWPELSTTARLAVMLTARKSREA